MPETVCPICGSFDLSAELTGSQSFDHLSGYSDNVREVLVCHACGYEFEDEEEPEEETC